MSILSQGQLDAFHNDFTVAQKYGLLGYTITATDNLDTAVKPVRTVRVWPFLSHDSVRAVEFQHPALALC